MNRERDLTTLELISIGIKAESSAVELYERMKGMCFSAKDVCAKFDFLIGQEQMHERILRAAFEKKFPGQEIMLPPKNLVPMISGEIPEEASLKELFAEAMKAEEIAEKFYNDLADKTRDGSAKSLLHYLASMERSHYGLLKVEYDAMEAGAYMDSEDALEGQHLMNLGP
ncbi:MAG: ferritin family protein [Candidatus Krumholzibacteriota bacterium]|nr:ferritin family protein [Candidatus Krumholzibacteriota bacterium]